MNVNISEHAILGKFLQFANEHTGVTERRTVAMLERTAVGGTKVVKNTGDRAFTFSARTEDQVAINNNVRLEFLKGLADYLGIATKVNDEKELTGDYILKQIQTNIGFTLGKMLLGTGDFDTTKGKPLSAYRIRVICEHAESCMKSRAEEVCSHAFGRLGGGGNDSAMEDIKGLLTSDNGTYITKGYIYDPNPKRDFSWLVQGFTAAYKERFGMEDLSGVSNAEFEQLATKTKDTLIMFGPMKEKDFDDKKLRALVKGDNKIHKRESNVHGMLYWEIRLRRALINAFSPDNKKLGTELYPIVRDKENEKVLELETVSPKS